MWSPRVGRTARCVCVSIATVSLAASAGLIALPDEVVGVLGLIR
jgi:hypothetical protein